jgi:SseB protein C-terminal domain/SseB protein N-terminal domain
VGKTEMSEKPIIPVEALEGVMTKAFVDKSVAPGLFWDALLKANLYTPISEDAGEIDESREFPMLLGVDDHGKNVVWFFTSPAAMVDYTGQTLRYVELPSSSMMANVRESEHEVFLIGPGALTLGLHPDLIDSLAEGKVPDLNQEDIRHIPKDAQVYVGAPTDNTTDLIKCFTTLFESTPNVTEAAFMQVADDSGSRLLLGISLKSETRDELKLIAQQVAEAAQGVLEKGKTMDITLINGSLKDAFDKWGVFFYKQ